MSWLIWILKNLPRLVLLAATGLIMANCTMLGMNYASLETANKLLPSPAINAGILISDAAARDSLKSRFEEVLYGPWPADLPVSFGDWQMINPDYLDGRGTLEEVLITVGSGPGARSFHLVTAFPNRYGPQPVVVSQTFSDNCSVFPDERVTAPDGSACDGSSMDGFAGWAATRIFGRFIAEAPVAQYFDAGLAYATMYASEFVPDRRSAAPDIMANLGGETNPNSALMAWGVAFSAALDVLEADPRIDPARTAVIGHSRHGKAALLAAAWDRRVDAVIAHQAGFAGASLSRSETGEGLKRMAESYPHWLSPAVTPYLENLESLPVDQHELLALVAPTPVLLGNGRRDVWSDPNSSYRAAQSATAVYEALGVKGLPDGGMRTFDPSAGIAWWLRAGGHSVVPADIDAFTAFLAAQFQTSSGGTSMTAPAN